MINFAIIGCGHIAKKHADAITNSDGAHLVAVCDTIPEKMDFYSETYKVNTYTDIEQLLINENIDVINICTPSGYHKNIAIQAAKHQKHIIVEKPIALTIEDANEMIDAAEKNKVKLAVVHPNRFRPAMIELKQIVDSNKLGKISHANATVRWNRNQAYYDQADWRGTKSLDGGVLMNQAIHNIDLLLWFMGEVEEVFSYEATRLRKIEAEDVSTGVVKFKNGSLGVVEAATTIYPQNLEESISIFGETGTVKVSGKTATMFEHLTIKSMNDKSIEELINKVNADPIGRSGHQCIVEDMIEAIKYDREPIVNGLDGKRALEFVLAFYESAEKNKPVKL